MVLTLPSAFTIVPLDLAAQSWADVEAHTRNWARDIGLDRTSETSVLLDAAEVGRYATIIWLADDHDRLCLGADLLTWLFVQDRVVDDHPEFSRDPSEMERLAHEAYATAFASGRSGEPIAVALADIVRRARRYMSPAWERRLARQVANQLATDVTAAIHRVLGTAVSAARMAVARTPHSGYPPVLAFIELNCGGPLPTRLAGNGDWLDFLDLACGIAQAANDLASVDRPFDPDDDVFSMVTHLRKIDGMTAETAFREITRRAERDIARFLDLERHLPRLFDRLALDHRERELAGRCVQGVRRLWRGTVEWITLAAHYQRPESSVVDPPPAEVAT